MLRVVEKSTRIAKNWYLTSLEPFNNVLSQKSKSTNRRAEYRGPLRSSDASIEPQVPLPELLGRRSGVPYSVLGPMMPSIISKIERRELSLQDDYNLSAWMSRQEFTPFSVVGWITIHELLRAYQGMKNMAREWVKWFTDASIVKNSEPGVADEIAETTDQLQCSW